jgi:uncharacterized protein (DUF305 family)
MRLKLMAGLLVLAVPANGVADETHSHAGMSDGSRKLHEMMEKSSREMPGMEMTGDVDKDFAKVMAEHHRSGIEMAEVELRHGKDPGLKKLAKQMIESQQKDISVLKAHD